MIRNLKLGFPQFSYSLLFPRTIMVAVAVVALWSVFLSPSYAALLSKSDIKIAKQTLTAVEEKKSKTIRKNIAKIKDPLLIKILQWFTYTEAPTGSSFQEISDFIAANPNWPRMDKLHKNAEGVMEAELPPSQVLAWFDNQEPVSTQGWVRYGAALLKQGDIKGATAILQKTWVEGSFTKAQEKQFYRQFRKYLTKFNHEARLDRLLWEGSYWPARRMFGKVNAELRLLSEARFLLRHMKGNVDRAIAAVPKHLKDHPGLIFERLKWRTRKGRDTAARELLQSLPDKLPYPDVWFKERSKLARRALNDGLISEAYRLVANHGLDTSYKAAYADAEWMSGWIALRFLNEPAWAYQHFTKMAENVSFPISRARGGYWAGRAASALSQAEDATRWYKSAAVHSTTYYGQLAALQVKQGTTMMVPLSYPVDNLETRNRFNAHELTRVAKLFDLIGKKTWLRSVIVQLQAQEETVLWKTLSADLATSLGRPDVAIKVSKYVAQSSLGLIPAGYPFLKLPALPKKTKGVALEEALVLALIRQESAYYVDAHSRAGARGLMQLMPATAKRVAKVVGLKYSKSRLSTDGEYNMKIGQSYLSKMVKDFDGSYILALASYNAGPGRAKRWVRENGHPRDAEVDAIDWVELIPFDETRNYVQRILEGVQVYRALLAKTEVALKINEDLIR